MSEHLLTILTDFCESPPVLTAAPNGCTISCVWPPPDLDFKVDVRFIATICRRGGYDVVMAADFQSLSPLRSDKTEKFLSDLRESVPLPFYLMTIDHARVFVKRSIWPDMEQEGAAGAVLFWLGMQWRTRNPKPKTQNPKPQTPNPKPQTPNPNACPAAQWMGMRCCVST